MYVVRFMEDLQLNAQIWPRHDSPLELSLSRRTFDIFLYKLIECRPLSLYSMGHCVSLLLKKNTLCLFLILCVTNERRVS
jgi:hypothetical protein